MPTESSFLSRNLPMVIIAALIGTSIVATIGYRMFRSDRHTVYIQEAMPEGIPPEVTTISMSEYDAIDSGMTLTEVGAIVGSRGATMDERTDDEGNRIVTRIWDGEGVESAWGTVTFINGIADHKNQQRLR